MVMEIDHILEKFRDKRKEENCLRKREYQKKGLFRRELLGQLF